MNKNKPLTSQKSNSNPPQNKISIPETKEKSSNPNEGSSAHEKHPLKLDFSQIKDGDEEYIGRSKQEISKEVDNVLFIRNKSRQRLKKKKKRNRKQKHKLVILIKIR